MCVRARAWGKQNLLLWGCVKNSASIVLATLRVRGGGRNPGQMCCAVEGLGNTTVTRPSTHRVFGCLGVEVVSGLPRKTLFSVLCLLLQGK